MKTLILLGILYQKGNGRRIVTNPKTRKPMSIKGKKVIEAFNSFVIQAKSQHRGPMLVGPVEMKATIYYPNNRHDLDDSLLCDALQAAGVIENDRYIYEKVLSKRFDKKEPRVVVALRQIEGQK